MLNSLKYTFLLFLGFTSLNLMANSISQSNQSYQLSQHLAYIIDYNHSLTLSELTSNHRIPWESSPTSALTLGTLEDAVWIRIDLPKAQFKNQVKLLEIDNHLVDHITFYLMSPNDLHKTELENRYEIQIGVQTPLAERPIHKSNFVFPVELSESHQNIIFMKVQSRYPMLLPFNLWDRDEYETQVNYHYLFYGVYAGIVLIMAIYNLCIFLFVRDKSYGYYALFITMLAGFILVDGGLMFELVWPNNPEYDHQMNMIFTALGCAFSIPFTIEFLQLKKNAPAALRFFIPLLVIWLLIAVTATVYPAFWLLYIIGIVLAPGSLSLLFIGALMWRRGFPAAPFFTMAWAALAIGTVIYDSYLFGFLPSHFLTKHALLIGNVVEVTLLSLGLASRIKKLDEERLEAQSLTKAKSEFLATMSHEIRTPMNGVLGTAQLLKDTHLDNQQSRYINIILNSGQSLLTILNDILDFSKIEADKIELERVPFDVYDLIYDTATIFSVQASDKKLYYNIEVDHHIPSPLLGDPNRLKQVLTNFISNGFKFTHQGSIIIKAKMSDDQRQLNISVQDTGIGIPLEKQNTIFEQFTQADSSTTRQYGGTGLGLSISKRFIELMGGDVGVESTPGKGSCFWLQIPIITTETSKEIIESLQESEVEDSKPSKKVLVLTPNFTLFKQLTDYLSTTNLILVHYQSINEFKHSNQTVQFDFVIVDYHCDNFRSQIENGQAIRETGVQNSVWYFLVPSGYPREGFVGYPNAKIEEYPVNYKHLRSSFYDGHHTENQSTENQLPQFPQLHPLIVDDNDINTMIIKGMLRKFGIEADAVDNGQAAIDTLCQPNSPYNLVFMDCEMPIMDGYQTTKLIREWEKAEASSIAYPICALSAHTVSEHGETCLKAGMDALLSKPITLQSLQVILEQFEEPTIQTS